MVTQGALGGINRSNRRPAVGAGHSSSRVQAVIQGPTSRGTGSTAKFAAGSKARFLDKWEGPGEGWREAPPELLRVHMIF